jgi:hypothetical protein
LIGGICGNNFSQRAGGFGIVLNATGSEANIAHQSGKRGLPLFGFAEVGECQREVRFASFGGAEIVERSGAASCNCS